MGFFGSETYEKVNVKTILEANVAMKTLLRVKWGWAEGKQNM